MKKINLGDEVKCNVTGFKGIVIGTTQYLFGCTRIGVQPKVDKDSKMVECQWFDELQLTVLKAAKLEPMSNDTGGPMPSTPKRQANPR